MPAASDTPGRPLPPVAEKLRLYLRKRHRRVVHDAPGIPASVLIPLVTIGGAVHLLLTKRTEFVEHHEGQISFPGGAADEGDASAEATALREAEEEIGLDASDVTLLGLLDDHRTPTGFTITPVLGYLSGLPPLRLHRAEVEEAFTVPLAKFMDPSLRRTEVMEREGRRYDVYFYDVWKEPVWGVTARFIKHLTDLLKRIERAAGEGE